MTSVFSAEGKNLPCTVIEVGPCVVTQIKTLEKDGYEAVQLGFQEKKEKHTTQPEMGHFKKAGVAPQRHLAEFKNFETEYKLGDVITVDFLEDAGFVDVVGTSKGKGFQEKKEKHTTQPEMGHFKKAGVAPQRHLAEFKNFETEYKLGDVITVDFLEDAGFVDVVGTSKGKGFQGVVKRHGFGGVGQTTHGQHNRARKPGSIGACSYPAKVFKGMRMGGQMGNERVTVQNLQVIKVMPEHNLLLVKGSVPGAKGSILLIEK